VFLLPVLARQWARAYEISNEIEKAKSSFNEFLALWKDADPDVPILFKAKAEYAKLKSAS
jgi:hypothetical protein